MYHNNNNAKSIGCALCQAITKIGDPRAHELNDKWQQGNMDLRASDRSMASSSAPVHPTSIPHSSTAASPSEESASVTGGNTEGKQKETVPTTQSFKNRQKKTGRKHAMCILNQAQHDSFRAPPTIPPPSASKQQLPLKDSGTNKPLATEELHAASSHAKRDVSMGESPKLLTAKGKKKKKDIRKAADAAGSTSESSCRKMNLKQENVFPGESIESSCSILLREAQAQAQAPTVEAEKDIITAKEDGQIKGVPDDWEDAAELSTPKLKTFVGKQGRAGSAGNNEDGNISKKYSRDFLLTLSEQCTDLPTGFKIRKDIAESLMSVQVGISHLIAHELNEAMQRALKAILNKLTPQNFVKQIRKVNIDNAVTLNWVVSLILDKALMEPRSCKMYANFCFHLAVDLPDFIEDNEKITFKRLLLNKCQEEFEREQAEANRVGEEREEKRIQARRKMLGNIRLIGELYKKEMLTERIMHEWIKKLLGQNQTPDEEDIESLCKLMSTIGVLIDHPQAKEHMDTYFDIMTKFSNNMELSSRVRFMLKDSIDLRNNKWQHRRKVKGWKKIDQVHRNTYHGNRDLRASSSAPVQTTSIAHPQTAPEKVLPEEQLRDMSISAIREFYSAKDKDELALCVKELNAPSFYPSMVSIWVTDSFERKDLERDLLARLLVDLTKPRDSLLNQVHLMKGFESVLGTLEDAVIDAPKAAEFLGRVLARVIMENVVPLKDIGHLIHEGGEEPGRLLQVGLAAEVLVSVLEKIKFKKGESVLNEIRTSSSLRLEDFRPPDPYKMRKLEAFL